jgi:quinol monooxygenase YgiN
MNRMILSEMRVHPFVVKDGYRPLIEILAGTRGFPGCLGLDVLIDRDDSHQVVLVVRWEDDDAYVAYRQWRAGPGSVELGRLLAAPSRLRWLSPL